MCPWVLIMATHTKTERHKCLMFAQCPVFVNPAFRTEVVRVTPHVMVVMTRVEVSNDPGVLRDCIATDGRVSGSRMGQGQRCCKTFRLINVYVPLWLNAEHLAKRSWYSRKAVLWLWNKNMFKPMLDIISKLSITRVVVDIVPIGVSFAYVTNGVLGNNLTIVMSH